MFSRKCRLHVGAALLSQIRQAHIHLPQRAYQVCGGASEDHVPSRSSSPQGPSLKFFKYFCLRTSNLPNRYPDTRTIPSAFLYCRDNMIETWPRNVEGTSIIYSKLQVGVRGDCTLDYHTALPAIFGVPKYAAALEALAAQKGCAVHTKSNLIEVQGDHKQALFENLDTGAISSHQVQYRFIPDFDNYRNLLILKDIVTNTNLGAAWYRYWYASGATTRRSVVQTSVSCELYLLRKLYPIYFSLTCCTWVRRARPARCTQSPR